MNYYSDPIPIEFILSEIQRLEDDCNRPDNPSRNEYIKNIIHVYKGLLCDWTYFNRFNINNN